MCLGVVFLVEVGVDSVGVGDGELGQGLVPVGGGLALDESAGGFAVFAFLAAVSLSVGSAFVFDVANAKPQELDGSVIAQGTGRGS